MRSYPSYTSTGSQLTYSAETGRLQILLWIIHLAASRYLLDIINISVASFPTFQHSALQYRLVPYTRPDQTQGRRVQLYIMDLQSANGTFVNNNKIEPQKYVQLMEKVRTQS